LSFFDERHGFTVGSAGVILYTSDGGATWQDKESPLAVNLFAVQAFGKTSAIAVGEQGSVMISTDSGDTWQIQPNITGKLLQSVAYRGGRNLWVAGRGGTILRRTDPLSPKTISLPANIPILRPSTRTRPTRRVPLITITDDGDIPPARPERP
jgi:photosystem II stability/assembly factor-like uncharacterized protein